MKNHLFSSKKPKIGFIALLLLLCGLFANEATAQDTFTWTGATDNNWATSTNWDKVGTASSDDFPGKTLNRVLDLVIISNGGTPIVAANANPYGMLRLTINNTTGSFPLVGSKLTINTGASLTVSSDTAVHITVAGGSIENNGTLKIEHLTNATASAGITFSTPITAPASATEYGYSGSGHLVMNTPSAAVANNCVFLVNAANTNSKIRLTFNGTTDFTLTSLNFVGIVIRAAATASTVSPLIIDGAGFTFGTSAAPKNGGLIGTGNRCNVTINPETTLNHFSATTNVASAIGVFMQNAAAVADQSNILNLGKINIQGTFGSRTAIQYVLDVTNAAPATASTTVANFENRGLLNVDVSQTAVSRGALWIGTFQTAGGSGIGTVNITNTATGVMNLINNQAFATNIGHAIRLSTDTYAPNVNISNSGILNLTGTNVNTASSLPKSRITNNGIINSNNNFNFFTVLNNSVGTIAFVSPAGAGSNAFAFGSCVLTNNGKVQTATGTAANSNLRNIGSYTATSTIEPGGAGYGISDLGIINATTAGTVKLQIAGNTAGVDYDQLNITNGGVGYSSAPTVAFSNGAGTGAVGYVTISSGNITAVTIVNGGSGYRNGAPVTFSVGSGKTGVSVVSGGVITGVTLSGTGISYTTVTVVTFSNAATTAAVATATMSSGVVTGITLDSGGAGYTNVPTVAFTLGGTPTTIGAVTANISGGVVTGFNTVFSLSGLNLDIPFLYTPTVATTLPIVTLSGFGTITGAFASVTGLKAGWALDYTSPTVVNLVYTPGTTTATSWSATAASTDWTVAGNWTNGVPTVSSNVTILAGTNQPVIGSNVNINSLTISTMASVAVNTGFNLAVTDVITNNGSLTIANNSNLIQVNNVTNTGNITVNRNSNALSLNDYIAWSSPVASQKLLDFSPMTRTDRFNTYNETTNKYNMVVDPATTNFDTATGYLIRMRSNAPVLGTETFEGVFTGVPNNGTINKAMTYVGPANGYNLVGNPYPSTIDAAALIAANTAAIENSLYFWRKRNGATGSAYAVFNLMGATTASPTSALPNGTIQVGQGFIVKAKSATNLVFTNALRVANNANQTFKTAQAQKDRLWLNMTSAAGAFSQALVGYTADATAGVDKYDAKYLGDSGVALTSGINNEEYSIQGRPTFDATDVVALNFKTNIDEVYTIALNQFDGVFATGQDVYLVDSANGSETDLKAGSYTFNANNGTDNTRFSLKFQKTLDVIGNDFDKNGVTVSCKDGLLTVNSAKILISKVQVYNLQGRLVAAQNNVNAITTSLKGLKTGQVLIVRVTLANKAVAVRKIFNK